MLTKSDLSKIQKIIDPLGKDIKKIGKKLDTFINFFDRQNINIEKRLSRVEKTLHFPPPADF